MSGAELAAWIGVAVMVVTLVTVIGIAVKQRTRKVLSYTANTEWPLVSRELMGSGIEIVARGKKLSAPHRLLVTVRNAGNAAIRPEDFERALLIRYSDAVLVDLQVESNVDGLILDVAELAAGGLEVAPLLLNPGEGFVITALVDGCPHEFRVEARVADATVLDETKAGSVGQAILSAAAEAVSSSALDMLVRALTKAAKSPSERVASVSAPMKYPTTRGRGPAGPGH